jgi:hypothetical protein
MKSNLVKAVVIENSWRYGVGLLACLFLLSVTHKSGSAQTRNQKRVTAVQMGQASEGTRVTVVSDSALSDYEAFRRGDRFYVKIPLADYTAAQPRLRGNGFENVQVQKFGDGVVVSFKLQAGASARVDQRSNRLDVIFSSANRTGRNNTLNSESNRVSQSQVKNPVTQGRDSAGPIPPGSPLATRERVVTERLNVNPTAPGQRVEINPLGDSNKIGNNHSTTSTSSPSSDSSSAVPGPSASSGYQALTTSTPAPAAISKPAGTQSGSTVSSNWISRTKAARQWLSANRLATLLGALLLLTVIVFLGATLYRRRKGLVKAKSVKRPLAQPKYSPEVELNQVVAASAASSAASATAGKFDKYPRPLPNEPSALSFPLVSVTASEINKFQERPERDRLVSEPALAPSFGVAATQNRARVLHQPSISSSTVSDRAGSDDQEREVFEL